MKITTKTKIGTTVANKVNGNVYQLTAWKDEAKTTAIAVAVNPETNAVFAEGEEGYDAVEVTEANGICFRTLRIPDDESILEGYTVKNGELLFDDEPATEQGEIVIKEIIAALPGYLVLAVKPRDEKDDLIDLFIYEPERDKFTKLIRRSSIPMPKTVKKFEDGVLLGYNQTHMEEEPDKDGVAVEVEYFDTAALMLVSKRKLNSVFFTRPMNFDSLKEIVGAENSFIIVSTEVVDEEGKVEECKPHYRRVSVDVESNYVSEAGIYPQPKGEVKEVSIVNAMDGGLMLKGSDFIQFGDNAIESKLAGQIKGNHLVDITRDGDDEIWSIATKEYEVSKIKKTRTKDRGNIYSLA